MCQLACPSMQLASCPLGETMSCVRGEIRKDGRQLDEHIRCTESGEPTEGTTHSHLPRLDIMGGRNLGLTPAESGAISTFYCRDLPCQLWDNRGPAVYLDPIPTDSPRL